MSSCQILILKVGICQKFEMKENQVSWIEPHLDISGVLSKPCHLGDKILVLFWSVDLCQQTFWSVDLCQQTFWSLCVDILMCYISLSSGLWNMDDWHKYPMRNNRNHQVVQLTSGWLEYELVDVCLIFLTDSNVVSPGSNDGTHMCGNDGNDPPKKVQELKTQNRVSEENGRKLGECSHQWL